MKVLAVNGSPRKTKNTASILKSICEGTASKGAEAKSVNLYSLKYADCVSCFESKLIGGKNYSRWRGGDGLTPTLQAAHEADVVIFGSPLYFFYETGMMRSFIERFMFQYHMYADKKAPLSPGKNSTALVCTMNVCYKSRILLIISEQKRNNVRRRNGYVAMPEMRTRV